MEGEAKGLLVRASIVIGAPPEKIWDALTDPEKIRRYMLGPR